MAPVRIVTVPSEDVDFAAQASVVARRLAESPLDVPTTVRTIAEQLRTSYPRLTVRRQNNLASFDANPMTWYFYRDGETSTVTNETLAAAR